MDDPFVPLYKMVATPLHERIAIEGLMDAKRGWTRIQCEEVYATRTDPNHGRFKIAQGTIYDVCSGFGYALEDMRNDFAFSRLLYQEGLYHLRVTMLHDEDDKHVTDMKERLARIENKISMRARRYWFILRSAWKVAPYVKHWIHIANRPGGQGFLSGLHAIMEL